MTNDNIKEIITKFIPKIIPSADFYYETVPENSEMPAVAYTTGGDNIRYELDGTKYGLTVDVSFGVVALDAASLLAISRGLISICKPNGLPGVQLIELIQRDDMLFDMQISGAISEEINMRFHM
ncbi:hypothetical protein [Dickeya phage Sucellus]|nr:hypothetical protein [Dickeya phage Sucellus]